MLGGSVEPLDAETRRLVRLVATLRRDDESLSTERRATLKARILRRVDVVQRSRTPQWLQTAIDGVDRRIPLLSRAAVVVLLLVSLAGGATIASTSALPEDPLYGLKLASERARLAVALDAAERAAVELTIAEHRLFEATALAERARDVEADAAASEFGEHLAIAAALLEEARSGSSGALVEQLRRRVARQQERYLDQARFASNASASTAITVLSEITTAIASGEMTAAARIADVAAQGAERAARNAGRRVPPARAAREPADGEGTRPSADRAPEAGPGKIESIAKAAREAAQRARQAADRAHNAAERAGTPLPTPTGLPDAAPDR